MLSSLLLRRKLKLMKLRKMMIKKMILREKKISILRLAGDQKIRRKGMDRLHRLLENNNKINQDQSKRAKSQLQE